MEELSFVRPGVDPPNVPLLLLVGDGLDFRTKACGATFLLGVGVLIASLRRIEAVPPPRFCCNTLSRRLLGGLKVQTIP